jgi:DNA adenine methylase
LFDTNPALIEVYEVVRDEVERLIEALQQHQNEKTHYYAVRAQDPARLSAAERAARFIYLNRTGYNGLYRVNRRGQYNVPFGRHKNPVICDRENLRAVSRALQTTRLAVADFEAATEQAGPDDLIYFDPPYAPLSATANFTSYTRSGFFAADQTRLAQRFHQLHERGCFLMLSNSSAPLIYELYQGRGYRLTEIQARRAINSAAHKRGPVTELLITNFPRA